MAMVKSHSRMVTNTKANFTMDYFMVKENLRGVMESSMKVNLLIIESQVTGFIDGQMEAYMKEM